MATCAIRDPREVSTVFEAIRDRPRIGSSAVCTVKLDFETPCGRGYAFPVAWGLANTHPTALGIDLELEGLVGREPRFKLALLIFIARRQLKFESQLMHFFIELEVGASQQAMPQQGVDQHAEQDQQNRQAGRVPEREPHAN
jgi:hypothetical protein